ncbi:MAG TPA: HAMP domain-containing sensor histidine kinase [Fulvivirga sp.]|nr:HAMP domain-containing sensor histidine kinase [Fulvivirga sp.]
MIARANNYPIQTEKTLWSSMINTIDNYSSNSNNIDIGSLKDSLMQEPRMNCIENIDLYASINEVINLTKNHSHLENIEVSVNIEQRSPFYTDKYRLTLILCHVIENSILFQDLRKHENFIDLNVTVKNNELVIDLLDNGIGMSKAIQKDIFKMFFKGSKLSIGFGIGLYVVKQCLYQLSGTINIDSAAGVGTHCIVKIPNSFKIA